MRLVSLRFVNPFIVFALIISYPLASELKLRIAYIRSLFFPLLDIVRRGSSHYFLVESRRIVSTQSIRSAVSTQ